MGYGHLISDLLGQLAKAQTVAATTAAAAAAAETAQGQALHWERKKAGQTEMPDLEGPGYDVKNATEVGSEAGVQSLISLQRFGGKCMRGLAQGAAFA